MKEYIKPEVEVIEFVTENVTNNAGAGGDIVYVGGGGVTAPEW